MAYWYVNLSSQRNSHAWLSHSIAGEPIPRTLGGLPMWQLSQSTLDAIDFGTLFSHHAKVLTLQFRSLQSVAA